MTVKTRHVGPTSRFCAAALEQAPFAALIFLPDEELEIVWRNKAHEAMSASGDRPVAGRPMFEAFPPNEADGGDAAVEAIRSAAAALRNGSDSVDIGPYRFDLPGKSGGYVEHHWQMQMSPISEDGRVVAILQVAQDVTHKVLSQRLADTHKRATRIAAGVSYFIYDPQTDVFVRGSDIDALFGFEKGEAGLYAAPFFDRVAKDHVADVHAEVARVLAAPRGEIASFDYPIDLPDGTRRFVRIRGEIATDPDDRLPKLVGTFVDLTDVHESRKKLEALLAMKEALLTEANHRIKNSLQMALSMLRLERNQLRAQPDATIETALDALSVAENRIRSVAAIHGMMRLNENAARVNIDDLLADLLRNTMEAVGIEDGQIELRGPMFGAHLDSDAALSFGLIANELLTNAIKYGWTGAADDRIVVTREMKGDMAILSIENGVAQEENRSAPVPSSGIGGELVESFLQQIDGALERETLSDRYRVSLSVPIRD
jgi:two-component sensor histidine kinase/PAS domain-containing protein